MPCPRTQHRNNVPVLRGEKHDISLKILHQAGLETARQAATLAKLRALPIVPCPSLMYIRTILLLGVRGERGEDVRPVRQVFMLASLIYKDVRITFLSKSEAPKPMVD